MGVKAELGATYLPSEDIVVREIEGELIIVPIVSGIGDMEDELFTLNETGRAIWEKLDGRKTLGDIIGDLSSEYEASPGEIERDVIGLAEELLKRKMLVALRKD
ncbi:MAG: hypothetical protein DRG87_07660 [Deltaproteobacteria bacterium]|nr:PqqD family protein [Deltaproteobacteria bacterium]MBW2310360.1 PqqD family protein [Deltaproteobacteria bacterium]RLB29203.1 MAG: hypothetical protein DRG87_07660 [Deltaproteobacteria bacterium]